MAIEHDPTTFQRLPVRDKPQAPVREMIRLDNDMYQALCREVQAVVYVNDKTTEIQAGYMLGVQAVLTKLREGFVVQR